MATKIPKKLIVFPRYPDPEETHLGFLHAHTMDAAGEKRRKTQMEWAYGYGGCYGYTVCYQGEFTLNSVPEKFQNGRRVWDRGMNKSQLEYRDVPKEFFPQIWDNDPLEGFKILESKSRYSTSNKVWRVLDPRGIVFEIKTMHLEEIMMATDILKGAIVGKCQWAGNSILKFVGM